MRRRRLLALTSALVAAISGCSAPEDGEDGVEEEIKDQPEDFDFEDELDVLVLEDDAEYVAYEAEKELSRDTDGEAVLQSAIDACPQHGVVHGNGVLEVTDSSITIDDSKTLTGDLTLKNKLPEKPCVAVQGTHEETWPLTSDSYRNDNMIEITGASSIASGDTVILERDEQFSPESNGNKGEIHQVKEVDESTDQITFYQPLYFDYPVDDNARAEHINPTSAQLDGISIEGTGSENDQHGIWFRWVKNSVVKGVNIDRCGKRAIIIAESYNVGVRNSTITRANKSGIGYGVAFSNGVAHCTVSECDIQECRHCVAHDSGPDWFGAPRNTIVQDNYFVSGKEQPIDAHENVISTVWRNNEIDTHTQAFVTGALETEIIDNVAYGGGAIADRGNNAAKSLLVEGNEFTGSGRIHLYNFSSLQSLTLNDNTLDDVAGDPIYVEVDCHNVTLMNNVITHAPASETGDKYAIQFTEEVQTGKIQENNIYGPWNDVYSLSNQSEITATDNLLKTRRS